MILTNILQNNTWLDSAQLSFHLEQVNFTFVSQNASASIILMRGENPFYVDKNDLTLQQLFIANNIKESTFHSLERDLRNLYQEMTNETELFIFLYNKDEGLLSF